MAFTAYERVFVEIQLESCPTAKAFAILDCILRFIEESLGLFKKLKKKWYRGLVQIFTLSVSSSAFQKELLILTDQNSPRWI